MRALQCFSVLGNTVCHYLVICVQPAERHQMSCTGGDHGRDPSLPAGRQDICGGEHKDADLGHYLGDGIIDFLLLNLRLTCNSLQSR